MDKPAKTRKPQGIRLEKNLLVLCPVPIPFPVSIHIFVLDCSDVFIIAAELTAAWLSLRLEGISLLRIISHGFAPSDVLKLC